MFEKPLASAISSTKKDVPGAMSRTSDDYSRARSDHMLHWKIEEDEDYRSHSKS